MFIFRQETTEAIAEDIINHFFAEEDLFDYVTNIATELVSPHIQYNLDSSAADFHCEVSGKVTEKLIAYLRVGYAMSKGAQKQAGLMDQTTNNFQ